VGYVATSEGREYSIEIVAAGHPWQVKVDETVHQVDFLELGGGLYSLIVDGRSYEVDIFEEGEALLVLVEGQAFRLELQEERERRLLKSAPGKARVGRQAITAPFPGRVVKVLVLVGDMVEAGDRVVILEAMKMENELKASGPGMVKEIRVEEGKGVGGGEVLVVIE